MDASPEAGSSAASVGSAGSAIPGNSSSSSAPSAAALAASSSAASARQTRRPPRGQSAPEQPTVTLACRAPSSALRCAWGVDCQRTSLDGVHQRRAVDYAIIRTVHGDARRRLERLRRLLLLRSNLLRLYLLLRRSALTLRVLPLPGSTPGANIDARWVAAASRRESATAAVYAATELLRCMR